MVLRCPYCLDDLLPQDAVVRCRVCRTPHHQACFRENEGCTSIGCGGVSEVDAGRSLYLRPALRLGDVAGAEQAFGPFRLVWRQLALASRVEESWQARQEGPWCRLSLEGTEVREGESLRGRASLFLPRAARVRKLELRISQGLGNPVPVARVQLLKPRGWTSGAPTLPAGRHPFELELRAPPITPHVDPFLLELVCVRGALQERLLSERQTVFLLQRAILRGAEASEGPRALILGPRVAPALPPAEVAPAALGVGTPVVPPIPLAPRPPGASGALPMVARPAAASAAEPSAPAVVDPFDPFDPFLVATAGLDGWRMLPLRSRGNGAQPRSLAARFAPNLASTGQGLTLTAPERHSARELPVQVAGGGPLLSLTLAVVAELVRPGGQPVAANGLPCTEEVRLLGQEGLEARRYGPEGLELRLEVAPDHLRALEQARAEGAHNAALRLHLALDGLGADGRMRTSSTRTVTVLPAP